MKVYAIIGTGSVGKSSMIAALTGVRHEDKRLMALTTGATFKIWARDRSLQEIWLTPSAFMAEATGHGVDAVLCALWPRSRSSKGTTYPDALGYLTAFQRAGWTIEPLVQLDDGRTRLAPVAVPPGIPTRHFSNSRTTPFNLTAATVRSYWSWA